MLLYSITVRKTFFDRKSQIQLRMELFNNNDNGDCNDEEANDEN